MRRKIKIGDIIEIQTKLGLAYGQFYHFHAGSDGYGTAPLSSSRTSPKFSHYDAGSDGHGALLRILPGFFTERPKGFGELAAAKEVFSTFFCVQAAVNRGIVQVAGYAEVPPHARPFPLFRHGFESPQTGKVEQWMLWDGVKQWKIGRLSDDQLDFPMRSIPSYPLLVDWLETGWTPRRADEFIDKARAEMKRVGTPVGVPKEVEEMRHYLIFNDQASGEKALVLIRKLGLQAELADLGESWGINVLQPDLAPDRIDEITIQLEKVASATGGIYDGTQVKLTDGNQ